MALIVEQGALRTQDLSPEGLEGDGTGWDASLTGENHHEAVKLLDVGCLPERHFLNLAIVPYGNVEAGRADCISFCAVVSDVFVIVSSRPELGLI